MSLQAMKPAIGLGFRVIFRLAFLSRKATLKLQMWIAMNSRAHLTRRFLDLSSFWNSELISQREVLLCPKPRLVPT